MPFHQFVDSLLKRALHNSYYHKEIEKLHQQLKNLLRHLENVSNIEEMLTVKRNIRVLLHRRDQLQSLFMSRTTYKGSLS